MQISKVQSQSFNGIHAQTSKMTRAQRELTARLTDSISYSDVYVKAKDMGIDICIFPKGLKNIKAKFLDTYSENFVKHKNKSAVTFSTSLTEENGRPTYSIAAQDRTFYRNADSFINKLKEVISGKYYFEDPNYEKIDAGDTDMYRLFKELKSYEIDANSSVVSSYLG